GTHLLVKGRVEEGDWSCRTTLRMTGDVWEGECSCREGDECASLVAVMLERLERDGELPEAPNEVDDQSLMEILEDRLGRELIDREVQFIDKLEKRYRRFELEGQMVDHDLVRLNPKWPVESYEPIQLWPTPPGDIVEFWNYIAYAFSNRNLMYPKFMEVITDLEAVENSLREWERERAEEEWKQSIFRFEDPRVQATMPRRFRILVTPSEARLQWSCSEGEDDAAHFETVQAGDSLKILRERRAAGALRLDPASGMILEAMLSALEGSELAALRLEDAEHAAVLNRIFHTPELEGRVVNLDEQVIRMDPRPIGWVAKGKKESDTLVLQLLDQTGEELPHSLQLLPGIEPLYLADESVFPGPAFWGEGTEVAPQYEIPRKVAWNESGVRFLTGIDAGLPDDLQEVIVDSTMEVSVRCRLNQKLTGSESEFLLVEIDAADPAGTRQEALEKDGWIISARGEIDDEEIHRYHRAQLLEFPDALEPLGLQWDAAKSCFKTRVTKTFPERFVGWHDQLANRLSLTTDEHLDTLLSDPVKASVTFEVVASEIDWFDLKIAVHVDGLDLTANEIRSLVAARGGFVRMKDGGWLRLEIDLTPAQADAVSKIGLDPFDLTGETHRMHVLQLAEPGAKEVFDEQAWDLIKRRADAL
ncbi:MAG: ATP-dependent helicase, partial [Verrucomicrobiota bacterium]